MSHVTLTGTLVEELEVASARLESEGFLGIAHVLKDRIRRVKELLASPRGQLSIATDLTGSFATAKESE